MMATSVAAQQNEPHPTIMTPNNNEAVEPSSSPLSLSCLVSSSPFVSSSSPSPAVCAAAGVGLVVASPSDGENSESGKEKETTNDEANKHNTNEPTPTQTSSSSTASVDDDTSVGVWTVDLLNSVPLDVAWPMPDPNSLLLANTIPTPQHTNTNTQQNGQTTSITQVTPIPMSSKQVAQQALHLYILLVPYADDFLHPASALAWLSRARPARTGKITVPPDHRWPKSVHGAGGYMEAFRTVGLTQRVHETKLGHWHWWYWCPKRVCLEALQLALTRRWREAQVRSFTIGMGSNVANGGVGGVGMSTTPSSSNGVVGNGVSGGGHTHTTAAMSPSYHHMAHMSPQHMAMAQHGAIMAQTTSNGMPSMTYDPMIGMNGPTYYSNYYGTPSHTPMMTSLSPGSQQQLTPPLHQSIQQLPPALLDPTLYTSNTPYMYASQPQSLTASSSASAMATLPMSSPQLSSSPSSGVLPASSPRIDRIYSRMTSSPLHSSASANPATVTPTAFIHHSGGGGSSSSIASNSSATTEMYQQQQQQMQQHQLAMQQQHHHLTAHPQSQFHHLQPPPPPPSQSTSSLTFAPSQPSVSSFSGAPSSSSLKRTPLFAPYSKDPISTLTSAAALTGTAGPTHTTTTTSTVTTTAAPVVGATPLISPPRLSNMVGGGGMVVSSSSQPSSSHVTDSTSTSVTWFNQQFTRGSAFSFVKGPTSTNNTTIDAQSNNIQQTQTQQQQQQQQPPALTIQHQHQQQPQMMPPSNMNSYPYMPSGVMDPSVYGGGYMPSYVGQYPTSPYGGYGGMPLSYPMGAGMPMSMSMPMMMSNPMSTHMQVPTTNMVPIQHQQQQQQQQHQAMTAAIQQTQQQMASTMIPNTTRLVAAS